MEEQRTWNSQSNIFLKKKIKDSRLLWPGFKTYYLIIIIRTKEDIQINGTEEKFQTQTQTQVQSLISEKDAVNTMGEV